MKKFFIVILVAIINVFILTGCPAGGKQKQISSAPDHFTSLLGDKHIKKEKTILGAATSIEGENKNIKNAIIAESVITIKDEIKNAPTQEILDAAKNDLVNKDILIKTLEENIASLQLYIKKLEDAVRSKQVWFFNIGGGALMLLGGAACYFGRMQWGLILIALGLFCFGIAQLVGLYWFKWAVLGVGVTGFAAIIMAIITDYNKQREHLSVDKEATDYYNVLIKMIPVFDEAYKNADQKTKDWMDKNILAKLSGKYNEDDKALIHTIRADIVKLGSTNK